MTIQKQIEYLNALADDIGGETKIDIKEAAQTIEVLLGVVEQLLNTPDLNHDSLEDISIETIEYAQKTIGA